MKTSIEDFVVARIEWVNQELWAKDSAYSAASAQSKELFSHISPLIDAKTEIPLTVCDQLNFQAYFENQLTINALFEENLYRQGYLDCICLLRTLGLFA